MILCSVCQSPEWIACAPGTAGNAQRWLDIAEFRNDEDIPLVAWCLKCWPFARISRDASS